jgi:tRNA pseudouridine55 synthase
VSSAGAAALIGIVLLDKPLGLSSNAALQRVRRVFGGAKAGHTGTLDPLATGMLPLCLGEATKIAGDLLDGAKAYEFTLQLGQRRSTGDLEGEVVQEAVVPHDWPQRLTEALGAFRGRILQVPPLYSALKRDGEPLYRLARRGESVEREARPVTIEQLDVLEENATSARLLVRCTKGTYVRTLAEDLAAAIGSCGHLTALRRLYVAPFEGQPMVTLEALQASSTPDAHLLPADVAVPQLPRLELGDVELARLLQGQRLRLPEAGQRGGETARETGRVRVYDPAGRFRGVAEFLADGVLHPRRLFNGLGCESA